MKVSARHHWLSIASFICFLHCILVPLIVIVSPTFGHLLAHNGIELLLLLASIICGSFIIHNGYVQHAHMTTVILFITGVSSWAIHLVMEFFHLPYHDAALYVGSFFVIVSYISNYYRMNNHCHICDHT